MGKTLLKFEKKYPNINLPSNLKEEMASQGFTIREQTTVIVETPNGDYIFDKLSGDK